ncbi:hypothetical protein [Umezawaea sp. Da 62-37]|uniref:hypothetical protein n=1 Tax=Umezawaea sp. Da 62-37 TaxID=3075927 RepID=UPI0028F74A12|nr:hypothetical protein [Umezawaea sp. Da 62-37]WNV89069.1 hypothetical protein RM788_12430 [Umezawaea sp. Da 62-37]
MRHLHWYWPPGVPHPSAVPILIVIVLLVATCAIRHLALLRLSDPPARRPSTPDRDRYGPPDAGTSERRPERDLHHVG